MNTQKLYSNYLDGTITKEKFLYEVRRDSNITCISPQNSFDDTVKILTNRRIISEDTYKVSKDIPLVVNEFKTIDQVNPYEYAKGIDYELDLCYTSVGQNPPLNTDLQAASKKVLKNLTTDPNYYTKKMYTAVEKKQEAENQRPEELTKKVLDAIGKGKKNIIRENLTESVKLKSKVLKEMFLTEEDLDDEDIRSEVDAEVERQSPKWGMEEGVASNDPKIERLVAGINALIAKAIDEDGDPIGVIDSTSTWEEPYIYQPIEYKNGALKIKSDSIYGDKPNTEVILKRNMEYDGLGTLRNIMRQYKKVLKKNNIQEDVVSPEEKKANDLSLAAEKAKVVASNKKIQDLQR